MINGLGSEIVAQTAAERVRVIAASTSDVYGKSPEVPFSEDMDSVIEPQVNGGRTRSRRCSKSSCCLPATRLRIRRRSPAVFRRLRPEPESDVVGGPDPSSSRRRSTASRSRCTATENQTRSFTYVTDHVAGIAAAVESSRADNLVVNIGAEDEITIRRSPSSSGASSRETTRRRSSDDPVRVLRQVRGRRGRVPDISRARDLLGFEPKVDLETGLQRRFSGRWSDAGQRRP